MNTRRAIGVAILAGVVLGSVGGDTARATSAPAASPTATSGPLVRSAAVQTAARAATGGIQTSPLTWRDDPVWHQGKAEWALYEAARTIYGRPRVYDATIFTNKQMADPATGAKTDDPRTPGAVEVFKHNLSEMVPTENYTYRFLTTGFARVDDLTPFLLTMSSQEDCGATYKRFRRDGRSVRADSFCYFPATGHREATWALPRHGAMHDLLSLTLRDYPFPSEGEAAPEPRRIALLPDQTDTRETPLTPADARIVYVGLEQLDLPIGMTRAHHLRVEHAPIGGRSTSDFWFADAPEMRRVMVQYEGPWGVRYELKRLAWWAYWADPRPAPDRG